MGPLFEFKDVSFSVKTGTFKKNKIDILENISFTLNKGELLAVVGESGCGKSTLGKIAIKMYKPTGGEVLFNGKNIFKMNRKEAYNLRPKIQMVFQDAFAALNPSKNVFNALRIPLKYYGTKKSNVRKKAMELLNFAEVSPPEYFLEKYPYHLSGGQRQRICFTRSLITEPEIIVADEPVSMIDMSLRIAMLDIIMKINKEKDTSFIFVTHELPGVKYLGQMGNNVKIIVMYLGSIVESCSVEQIFIRPLHPYTQALLSASPVPDPKLAKKMGAPKIKMTDIPNIAKKPSGCHLQPKCIYAEKICSQEKPQLRELENGHKVSCHLAEKIPIWKVPSEE